MTDEFIRIRLAVYRMLGRADMSRRTRNFARAHIQLLAASRIARKMLSIS